MEKSQTPKAVREGGSKPPSTAPAYFVILHQSQQGDGMKEGILVANRDVSSVAPVVSNRPDTSKSEIFLSADCVSGEITVTLDNNNMWNEFFRCSTEMVLTKQGRRMFPYCRYWISGLDPYRKYILVMDITPLDTYRYKWNGKWWEPGGKAEPHVLGRVFIHPESPSTGQYWMHQPVSFYKLKLTNNVLDQDGHIILHSMHRYLPRLHVIPADKATAVIQLNGPDVHTFTFPQTEFIAVTAYQNFQITQLKIDCNPFAKGFRDGATGRFTKESKQKQSEQEMDSLGSNKIVENDDPESIQRLRELFRMSEHSDADTENEAFNAEHDFLNFSNPLSRLQEDSQLKPDNIDSFRDRSGVTTPSEHAEKLGVEIKQEPEDNYDYSKTATIEVDVKQEESEDELTDEYSNSDDDYPILERHFAQFRAEPHRGRKRSVKNSQSGVAKAKLLKLGNGTLPMVYMQPCSANKNTLEPSDLQEPALSVNPIQSMEVPDTPLSVERCPISPKPNIIPHIGEEVSNKDKRERLSKNKVNAKYGTPQTALSTSNGPKKKLPFLLPKSSVTETPGNESTQPPIVKKRGRPRKHKVSKVGRPTKKGSPIEAPRLCPDFKPDLEDVDGVLFVAFSSKEALDVHTGEKPKTPVPTSFSAPPESSGEKEEVRKFAELERQLVAHLRTMRYRQVIHPALQQVGLKLNIVDPTMSIDLRYLGVELPLPHIPKNTRWDNYGICAQASGFPFVSRTGKTSDYTKIKGWRDKFSTTSTASSLRNEASILETTLKNRSAFCSDELDEYLENEAKLMGDLKGLSQIEPVSTISYQLPTKSSSYVRTLDSVLKKQAPQATSASTASKPLLLPAKKRKYTRRALTPKAKSQQKPISPSPVIVKEKTTRPQSAEKQKHSMAKSKPTPPDLESPSTSKPRSKPPEAKQKVTVQPSSVPHVEDKLLPRLHKVQNNAPKPLGFSKVQTKLMELEECALWQGKPRTFITEERAEISLSTLLTAQASLKNKPVKKMVTKRTTSCKNEFCRLGCVCSSLTSTKHKPTHCHQVACMLGCDCLKRKLYLGKDGFKVKSTRTTQEVAEGEDYSSSKHEYGNEPQPEQTVESQEVWETDKTHSPTLEEPGGAIKTNKRTFFDCNDTDFVIKHFPIWDRSDVDNDPEPLCIPKQAKFLETKVPHHKKHLERSKSSGGIKSGRLHKSSTAVHLEDTDPVFMYLDSMMTCARVRAYECKAPEEKAKKDQCTYSDSDTPGKEQAHKSSKHREPEKEDTGDDDVLGKRHRKVDNNGPTKLIEIISDNTREQDRSKILNIVSQHMNNREPQSFKVGSFNIELMPENKSGEKSTASTASSRVKISMAPDEKKDQAPAKPSLVKWRPESVKPPDQKPLDISTDQETKSHGGKGLPFYTKVIPAGKLVARLKNSTVNESELIQVNGKSYPQAKLLLGQMGALHPANRLAAYITHRLRPSLFHLSKLNVNAKMAMKNIPTQSTGEGDSKDTMSIEKTVTSPQNKSAAQSTPSSVFTQFVMGEVGTLQQKSPGVSSLAPTIIGSPKLSAQSTRLLFITSPGKQAPVVSSSPSVNMTSLPTPSLSSAGLGTTSPVRNKAAPSPPKLIPIAKLVTKDSSLSISAGSLSNDATRPMTLKSIPSTKESLVLPPTLVRALPPTVTTSTVTLSINSASDKGIATSVASCLVTSPNVPTHESVAPLAGINIAPPVTLKSVTSPPVSALKSAGASPGLEKRLGPRLLLIPVPTGSAPVRPIQCVQTSPGQKMVLQPIRSPSGVNLFRHPNGQIIQLVPLQQVHTGNFQPSTQQVAIRNSGSAMGVHLPLPTKTEAVTPSSASIVSTSIASPPAALPIVSVSKTSPVKSGVAIVPSNPSVFPPLGPLTTKASPPTTSNEVPPTTPKVVAYTSGGHTVITSNVMPQSGGLSLVKVPPPTAPCASPHNAASRPNIVLMNDKPTHQEGKQLDDSLSSPVASVLCENKLVKEDSIECEGLPSSEIVKTDDKAEVQDNPKESVISVEQVGLVQSTEEMSNGKCQDEQRSNERSSIEADVEYESSASREALLQEATKKESQCDLAKWAQSPADREAQSPSLKEDGYQRPTYRGDCDQRPTDRCEWDPSPTDRCDGDPSPTDEGDGDPNPTDGGDGDPSPKDGGDGDPSPTDGGDGDPSPTDGGDGDPSPTDGGDGDPSPTDGGDGSPSPTDGGDGGPSPTDGGDGGPSPTDGGDGGPSPTDGGDGGPSPTDGGDGGPSPTDGGDGGPSPTDGGDGCPSPTDAGDGCPSPTDGGDGGPNPTDGGDGGPNPTDGGDGGPSPTDGGDGGPSPTDKRTQSSAYKSIQSPVKKGEKKSPFESVSPHDSKQMEATACSGAEQQREGGEKATKSSLLKQSTARSQVSKSSANQEKDESLTVDPFIKESTSDKKEIPETHENDRDLIELDSHSEDESEVDESVDIETVEELSEKINIARLRASATTIAANMDKCGTSAKFSKGRMKVFKVNGDDIFSMVGDGDCNLFHRQTHTANERKRRNEMRDLFDELKNALCLHNLPKVSKSYILKQAIEEIEGLTDAADTLIRKKTLLSQKQSQLIKKVSNLSGKPKDVVLKKLEYVYAKQKAVEAERKKKNLEEDLAVLQASINSPSPKRELFPTSVLEEEEAEDTSSSKTKKPIILARKPVLLSMEAKPQQPGVSTPTSSLLMASTGQVVTLTEAGIAAPVTGIPPTLVQADLSPAQIESGMTSVVIQLPSTIQLKSIIGNSPVPITLSAVPDTISAVAPSPPESEKDDLSMMPKIVNVTSLANEASSDLGRELGIGCPVTAKEGKSNVHTSLTTETAVRDNVSVQVTREVADVSSVSAASILVDSAEENFSNLANETQSPDSRFMENLPLGDFSRSNNETSSKSEDISMNAASFEKISDDVQDSELELELKKLSSVIDDAELDPAALSDVMGDQEDADETLTSLLDEIALLNHQLNNDTADLDSGSDFLGSDTASRGSVSKFTDGDASPFSFRGFKELSETKEKNISLSPLFMQLEDGEIQENIKHAEDASIVLFADAGAVKDPLTGMVEKQPPVPVSPPQQTEKPVTSGSDVLWKPMPKLAPLGLKSPTLTSDPKAVGNISMPSLASVAARLNSSKTTD